MPNTTDITIIRELAARVAEIAALPVQESTRKLWRKLNGLRMERPMVTIDQVCWNELEVDGDLKLRCTDKECQDYERTLRRTLYQWKHFPVDMVVEPFIRVRKAITNTEFGIKVKDETIVTDPQNDVVAHEYVNQFRSEDDVEKIQTPRITHDPAETRRRLDVAHELFGGLLEARPWGADPYLSLWDLISMWMGVQNALYAIIDTPELIHKILQRLTDGYLSMLDQLEEQGLLCHHQSLIHCTGAWTDELPAPGFNPEKPRTKDIWMFGLAQMLATVSPEMFDEFEVQYASRICQRFGLVYYGCCDPLHGKMDQVRKIPGVRKVSMSPWVDEDRGAAEIGHDFVYSRKPNPALLASTSFDEAAVRKHLADTRDACRRHGCALEFILKDISTIGHDPTRLFRWAAIAMEVACG